MEKSGFLMKLTGKAIDTLTRFTRADIRVHDAERIPNQPVVFVVNHFTRMETFFLPNIIYKETGKFVYALAHHSFFKGAFGTFMQKMGAVSTKDPERDRTIIGSLLRGDMPCIIFPEGQMIKDKKLVEKGKYMIYNTGIRRPPHTGAAHLAMRAQFYREEFKNCWKTGDRERLMELQERFGINDDELEKVNKLETYIVPVNITYFPVRARVNLINRIANMLVDRLPERIEEELEVEGSMLLDGVDIDINFGEPLAVSPYLDKILVKRKIKDKKLYLDYHDLRNDVLMRKVAIDIMYTYMREIYHHTTINHDHVFSYILMQTRGNTISLDDFKNRAFLAIEAIKDQKINTNHTVLFKRQGNLLRDEPHRHFDNFIDAAKSDGLIFIKDDIINIKKEHFSKSYEFHTIRRDNIVEVLKNEIEPLRHVTRRFDAVVRMPSWYARRKIRNLMLKKDLAIFAKDYREYFVENESKTESVGTPFFLRRRCAKKGVLLIHGYMAAPEEIRQLADYLYKSGFTVYGVRLRGHGTSPDDLVLRKWEEWYESVNRGYVVLKNSVRDMSIAGFSTGAGLALLGAARKNGKFKTVVSISAPLKLVDFASNLVPAVDMWNKLLKRFKIQKGAMEFIPNHPDNPQINYTRNPVSGVYQMELLMNEVNDSLNNITIPALVMQGSGDPTVNPEGALEIFKKIPSIQKELTLVYSEKHGIVRGDGAGVVHRRVERFLKDNM